MTLADKDPQQKWNGVRFRFGSPQHMNTANIRNMTILLVRHGETDGNASRVLQRADVPLNERGMRQAERLARRLFAVSFTSCVVTYCEHA